MVDSIGGKNGTIQGAVTVPGVYGNALYFDGATTIEVGRDRFVPVKTTNDLLVLRSDCYDLDDDGVLHQVPGSIPFVDLAYQGFGDGLEEDAAATRMIAAKFPEVLIAASCSKNFGVYRDRAGILISISADAGRSAMAPKLSDATRVTVPEMATWEAPWAWRASVSQVQPTSARRGSVMRSRSISARA